MDHRIELYIMGDGWGVQHEQDGLEQQVGGVMSKLN